MSSAYLDYAASAPRRDDVFAAMEPWLHGVVGNPSGAHGESRRAARALEEARDEVAELVGSPPGGVVFTGGGTESCHLAIAGVTRGAVGRTGRATVVVSAIEHHAVLDSADALAAQSAAVRVDRCPVGDDGVVDVEVLGGLLDPAASLVSVMTANNETGVVEPIARLAARVHEASAAVFHTDAVAAAPWLDLRTVTAGADLVSLCAHKLGGPVNSGALVLRRPVDLTAVSAGGGQERGRRGGTVDVAAAVGLAAALRAHDRERHLVTERVRALRDRLEEAVAGLPGCRVTAASAERLAGTAHLTFESLAADELVFLLDEAGVCASAGAACSSGATTASHVLVAMGMDPARAGGSVRLTLGFATTAAEVDQAIDALGWAVGRLRAG